MSANRWVYIDALRGLAALYVLFGHTLNSYFRATGSDLGLPFECLKQFTSTLAGVFLFFAISGYVIPGSFARPGWKEGARFAIRRFFRLYPLFWVALIPCLMHLLRQAEPAYSWSCFWANSTMVPGLFDHKFILSVSWTLVHELLFYLVCLSLQAIGWLQQPAKIATCLLGCLGAYWVLLATGWTHTFFQKTVLLCQAFMLWGSLWRKFQENTKQGGWVKIGLVVLPLQSLFFLGLRGFYTQQEARSLFPVNFASSILAATLIFLMGTTWFKIQTRWLVWCGTVSYSIYLFHMHIVPYVFRALNAEKPSFGLILGLVLAGTCSLSALTYRWVERPFIQWSRQVHLPIQRLLSVLHLVDFKWWCKVKLRCLFSRKIKVGFGPIASGEDNLAERKWRIDPILEGLSKKGNAYVASFFVHPEEMKQFDIVVLVKKINPEFVASMQRAKRQKFIYDIVDNPNDEEKYRFYFRHLPGFVERIDGWILSSPVHQLWMRKLQKPFCLIEHPVINSCFKTRYENGQELRLLAQGYWANLENLQWLEPFLPGLSQAIGRPVLLWYHSEKEEEDTPFVRHIRWRVENCFSVMRDADIALTIKDLHFMHQYTKPSTKVIAYMAAGLPVICKPTAADREVVQHGITGFFAYRREDFLSWIEKLGRSSALRRQVGRAARKKVLERYSVSAVLQKYIDLLDSVRC